MRALSHARKKEPFMAAATIVASAARTVTGNSGSIGVGAGAATIELEVIVSAVTGTSPSMTLSVLWSEDGTNFGNPDGSSDAFTAITAATSVVKALTVRAPYMEIVWTISGTTPSFTFSVLETGSNVI
jgi:hypothetical protein